MNSTAKAVEAFLSKIERTKDLNIFLEVWADEALKRANKIDLKISEGKAEESAEEEDIQEENTDDSDVESEEKEASAPEEKISKEE